MKMMMRMRMMMMMMMMICNEREMEAVKGSLVRFLLWQESRDEEGGMKKKAIRGMTGPEVPWCHFRTPCGMIMKGGSMAV